MPAKRKQSRSGGLSSAHTKTSEETIARALRMAPRHSRAVTAGLASITRPMRAKPGGPKAVTATAHKLARIVYHRLSTGQAYDETVFAQQKLQNKQRNQSRLRQQTRKLGFELTQIPMEA
jgi:transposase